MFFVFKYNLSRNIAVSVGDEFVGKTSPGEEKGWVIINVDVFFPTTKGQVGSLTPLGFRGFKQSVGSFQPLGIFHHLESYSVIFLTQTVGPFCFPGNKLVDEWNIGSQNNFDPYHIGLGSDECDWGDMFLRRLRRDCHGHGNYWTWPSLRGYGNYWISLF